jgi:hypothetical protein
VTEGFSEYLSAWNTTTDSSELFGDATKDTRDSDQVVKLAHDQGQGMNPPYPFTPGS